MYFDVHTHIREYIGSSFYKIIIVGFCQVIPTCIHTYVHTYLKINTNRKDFNDDIMIYFYGCVCLCVFAIIVTYGTNSNGIKFKIVLTYM